MQTAQAGFENDDDDYGTPGRCLISRANEPFASVHSVTVSSAGIGSEAEIAVCPPSHAQVSIAIQLASKVVRYPFS